MSDVLKLKPNYIQRAVETDSVGEDDHWSANGLYRHLCMLEGLVPRTVSVDVESPFLKVHWPERSCGTLVDKCVLFPCCLLVVWEFKFKICSQRWAKWSAYRTRPYYHQLFVWLCQHHSNIDHWSTCRWDLSLVIHKFLFHSFLAELLLTSRPQLKGLLVQDHALFVMEVKGRDRPESHIPQAICEMYACARHIKWVNFKASYPL